MQRQYASRVIGMKSRYQILRSLGTALLLLSFAVQADTWVLALSWAPGFCAVHPEKKQCGKLGQSGDDDAAYARSNLTLHGLWPRRQDCKAPPLRVEDLPPALPHYMPGVVDGLATHEWNKHGSCSGYTARGYFDQMIAMAEQAAESPFGRYLHAHAGERVALSTLRQVGQPDFRSGGVQSVRFICLGERLAEVRFSLRDWSQSLAAPAVPQEAAEQDRCDESVLL